jgi:hypothetical protein
LDALLVDRPWGAHQDHEIVWVVGEGGGDRGVGDVLNNDERLEVGAPFLQMGAHPFRCGQRVVFDDESAHGAAA